MENFRMTRWGTYAKTCNECMAKAIQTSRAANKEKAAQREEASVAAARGLRLQDFSPRELMEELARRGYEGKLKYTRVEEIDITNF